MIQLFMVFLLSCLLSWVAFAQTAVLIEEGPATRTETRDSSYLFKSKPGTSFFRPGRYLNVSEMKLDRRLGVGVEAFGKLGSVGLQIELNLGPEASILAGTGAGPGYQTMSLGMKHVFGGSSYAPYVAGSWAYWAGKAGGSFDGTNPSFLETKFLSQSQKESGQFQFHFLVPAIGLQLNQLVGDRAGAVFYAEAMIIAESSTMAQTVTGALGAQYSF